MKKLLLFLFAFISITFYAQLDREHWFAPMVDKASDPRYTYSYEQRIYMSTGEPVPFQVEVYSNNVLIGSVTISKGSPQKFDLNRSDIITTQQTDLFLPIMKGIYLKGEKPFFASLRFSMNNHAEILTSKGTAGIGKEFRAVMAPITSPNQALNFMTSVMATENNTMVTITDFNSSINFSDGIMRSSFNFTLDKGQSYIINANGIQDSNSTGFTGAKIVADKPVTITNGNFNGQYASYDERSGSDILMDQGVPIDKLGQEFVLMKGNGALDSGMEKAIIVATEDGTEIYLNDDSTVETTLNAGQFYETDDRAYIQQGADHYNMRIRTNKNVYAYQLLAGAPSSLATGGFNYIPPLSCYLPKEIDEIGFIDENRVYQSSGFLDLISTKLNIITQRGATVAIKENGVNIPASRVTGPFDVAGNDNWVTYSVPGVSGTISINSSSAVTAGISAGNGNVGYGGYFAGFSSIPLVTKIAGDCLPGVTLAVTEGFDSYQWLIKMPDGSYQPAAGSNSTFSYQPGQAGIYAVKVKQGSCEEIQTQDYKFFNCTTFTNYDEEICTSTALTPLFALSNQSVNNATIRIDESPSKGTVVINPNGTLTYTANPNTSGTDTLKYSFCGIGTIPDCETIQVTLQIRQPATQNDELTVCSDTATGIFDLSAGNVTVDSGITKRYYTDSRFTAEIPSSQLTNYTSTAGTVYVKLINTYTCEAEAQIRLVVAQRPQVNLALFTTELCDEDVDGILDGIYRVNLSNLTTAILRNPTSYTVRYYDSKQKADYGTSDILPAVYSLTTASSIWIRVDSPVACASVIKEVKLNTGTLTPLLTRSYAATLCDDKNEGAKNIILSDYTQQFSTASGTSAVYYQSLDDAKNNRNPLADSYTLAGTKTLYARIINPGFCTAIATLELTLRKAKTSASLPWELYICAENTTTIDAGDDFDAYLWSTGETGRRITVPVGEHYVDLLKDHCTYRQKISVKPAPVPTITGIDIQGTSATIITTGGTAPLLYSLDGGPYQKSATFTGVSGGNHTVYITSADNCQPVTGDLNVISLYNVITPNGDLRNDTFNYSGLISKTEPSLQIFDRYGSLVFTGEANNHFSWDGKIGGKTAATGSYWYVMKWREPGIDTPTQYTGWVMVKNRD